MRLACVFTWMRKDALEFAAVTVNQIQDYIARRNLSTTNKRLAQAGYFDKSQKYKSLYYGSPRECQTVTLAGIEATTQLTGRLLTNFIIIIT